MAASPALEKQLEQAETSEGKEMTLLRYRVTDEEIAEVLSKATGIPVSKRWKARKKNSCVWKMNYINE